jgi:beta-1,2-mannobiose phosphorylase / 1,2-beta-oligomannan phosphorylase
MSRLEVPYRLTRVGTVMVPEPGRAEEADGVLNPASGYGPDGRPYLLPRVVAHGNYSRIGLAEVLLDHGVPVSVERRGIVLEPDEEWEHGFDHGGVEDPRVTWLPDLGVHIMTYVAFGPIGPRLALASSEDLRTWRRLGPVLFGYEPDLQLDFNLFPNKDAVFFPEPVPGPDGKPCWAMLHRPMWNLGWIRTGERDVMPAGLDDPRPGIWISYVPVAEVGKDVSRLVRMSSHRLVALSQHPYEMTKIGAGPPPRRVPEGWLLLHHGVSGEIPPGTSFAPTQGLVYSVGAMILSADDPSKVVARTSEPLMHPDNAEEQVGTVSNVVFPTCIEETSAGAFVFYGMADMRIGVAHLDRVD